LAHKVETGGPQAARLFLIPTGMYFRAPYTHCSERREFLLPATASMKGLKTLAIFNERPRPNYGPPEAERQGAVETLAAEDLLNLYLSLPEEKRQQKFANTSEAARMVGLSRRTIQMWIEVGLIAAIKIGRKYQVSVDSLRAYLKSRADY
jgi:excisionase family DNA binding protein